MSVAEAKDLIELAWWTLLVFYVVKNWRVKPR